MRRLQNLPASCAVSLRELRSKIRHDAFRRFETFNVKFEFRPAREPVFAGDREKRIGLRDGRGRDRSVARIAEAGMKLPDSSNGVGGAGPMIGTQVFRLVLEVSQVGMQRQLSGRHVNFPFSDVPGIRICRQKGQFFENRQLLRVDFCPFRGLGAPLNAGRCYHDAGNPTMHRL